MKYSKATNYALHTMIFLGSQKKHKLIGLQELADHREVSSSYLAKILTKLSKKGLIISYSGAQGGFQLSKKPTEISLLDIIHAIEGEQPLFQGCMDGNGAQCLLENIMRDAEQQMDQFLSQKMLSDVLIELQMAEGNTCIN